MKILYKHILFIASALIFINFSPKGQLSHLVIKGKTQLISKSKTVTLYFADTTYTSVIKKDHSFLLDIIISQEGRGAIKTDSSFTTPIWITPGLYNITLIESKKGANNYYGISLKAETLPKQAQLFNNFETHLQYFGSGDTLVIQKRFVVRSMDSILLVNPKATILPDLLKKGYMVLGSKEIINYINRMKTPGTLKKLDGLLTEVQQREMLKPGLIFANFSMKGPTDSMISFYSLNSKLTLIEFWGSDCPPCRSGHVSLRKKYDRFHNKGLEIVSISTDNNKEEWIKSIANDKMNWVNVSDLKGWNNELVKKYFIYYEPKYIWLDKDHRIISGGLSDEKIEKFLNE